MDKRVITSKDARRKHGETLKRDLVERSLRAGASVAAIAQKYGINAILLFNWRRLHLQGQHASAVASATPTLLPVTVQTSAAPSVPKASPPRTQTGVIEIDIGAARVRLRGAVDQASVRCVLQTLLEFAG